MGNNTASPDLKKTEIRGGVTNALQFLQQAQQTRLRWSQDTGTEQLKRQQRDTQPPRVCGITTYEINCAGQENKRGGKQRRSNKIEKRRGEKREALTYKVRGLELGDESRLDSFLGHSHGWCFYEACFTRTQRVEWLGVTPHTRHNTQTGETETQGMLWSRSERGNYRIRACLSSIQHEKNSSIHP